VVGIVLLAILLFLVGIFIGWLTFSVLIVAHVIAVFILSKLFPTVVERIKRPEALAVVMLILSLVLFMSGLILSMWFENNLVLYLFSLLAGVAAFWPIYLTTGLFQLRQDPQLYEEYIMKKEVWRNSKASDEKKS